MRTNLVFPDGHMFSLNPAVYGFGDTATDGSLQSMIIGSLGFIIMLAIPILFYKIINDFQK